MQDYHKLRVWKRAQDLAVGINRLTRTFPRTGYASIKDQMVRAAESVGANIVEGCGSSSNPDFARFLDFSIKSASEMENHLETAARYGILSQPQCDHWVTEVRGIRKMTWGLRRRVVAAQLHPGVTEP